MDKKLFKICLFFFFKEKFMIVKQSNNYLFEGKKCLQEKPKNKSCFFKKNYIFLTSDSFDFLSELVIS